MIVSSFEELVKIDERLASLFADKAGAVNWVRAVNSGGQEFISKYNKQYWELVRYVSNKRGVFNKKCTRDEFAKILLKFCSKALSENETVSKLSSSMGHYEHVDKLKDLDNTLDNHVVRRHIKDAEALLDNVPITEQEVPVTLSPADWLEKYLRSVIDEDRKIYPRERVVVRPQYEKVNPILSVEKFVSEKFLKENTPSYIIAYEFVDTELNEGKAYEFAGKYSQQKRIKLFIVSSKGMTPGVRKILLDNDFGFILFNPNQEMSDGNIILPRTITGFSKGQHEIEILYGYEPQETPLLILDNEEVTSSLVDCLVDNNIAVKEELHFKVPYLKKEDIETKADKLTSVLEENQIKKLSSKGIALNDDISINPFDIARELGLACDSISMKDSSILGLMNPVARCVSLNTEGSGNNARYRFTMAHELGHYILHMQLFDKYHVTSIAETENSLFCSEQEKHRLEYQANVFASYLLMPKKLVTMLYVRLFDVFVSKRYGDSLHPLYYNPNQPETWDSYNNVVGNMARMLVVSEEALRIRLVGFNLLRIVDN